MRMYKCMDCGCEFITPKEISEGFSHAEVDNRRYEELVYQSCPECDSEYIIEGNECIHHEGAFAEGEFCKECHTEFSDAIEAWGRARGMAWKETKLLATEWAEQYGEPF